MSAAGHTFWQAAASYDSAGTVIRLSYTPPQGASLLEDPSLIHELAHYGQNLGTSSGIEQTLVWDELWRITCEILRDEDDIAPPLVRFIESRHSHIWNRAEMLLSFIRTVIGGPNIAQLHAYNNAQDYIKRLVHSIAFHPQEQTPFRIVLNGPAPFFELILSNAAAIRCDIDDYFVREINAHAAAFIERGISESLTVDDVVESFFHSSDSPYSLFYFVVQHIAYKRRATAAIVDCVLICHLCSYLALNAHGLRDEVDSAARTTIGNVTASYKYRSAGELFLRVLQACLRQFRYTGQALEEYSNLLQLTLWDLGWPPLGTTLRQIDEDLIAPVLMDSSLYEGTSFRSHTRLKLEDSRRVLRRLLDADAARDWRGFVSGAIGLIADGSISGPVVASMESHSRISGNGSGLVKEQLTGLVGAEITRRLWFGSDLTCTDHGGPPTVGSVIGCKDWPTCSKQIQTAKAIRYCRDETWIRCLSSFPGLYQYLTLDRDTPEDS